MREFGAYVVEVEAFEDEPGVEYAVAAMPATNSRFLLPDAAVGTYEIGDRVTVRIGTWREQPPQPGGRTVTLPLKLAEGLRVRLEDHRLTLHQPSNGYDTPNLDRNLAAFDDLLEVARVDLGQYHHP